MQVLISNLLTDLSAKAIKVLETRNRLPIYRRG